MIAPESDESSTSSRKTQINSAPQQNDGHEQDGSLEANTLNPPVGEGAERQQTTNKETEKATHNTRPATRGRISRGFGWGRRKFWDSWKFDETPSVFEALTFIVSVVGVYFLIQQVGQTDRALWEAKEANRLTREAQAAASADSRQQDIRLKAQDARAEKQLGIAEMGVQQTKDAMRLDQRAWVGLDSIGDVQFAEGKAVKWTVAFVNSGKTPAVKFVAHAHSEAFQSDQPFHPVFSSLPTQSVGVIQPNQHVSSTLEGGDNVGAEELRQILAGTKTYYFYGKLTYDDVFGMHHATTFCGYFRKQITSVLSCSTYNNAN